MRRLLGGLALAFAPALPSCGGCSKEKPPEAGAAKAAAREEPAAAVPASARPYAPNPASDATVRGRVVLKGTAPPMPPLSLSVDPVCEQQHQGERPRREEVVANPDGTLRNVLVYVEPSSKAIAEVRFGAPNEPFLLDQLGCVYRPHVFAVMEGQPIRIRNSDPTSHNINTKAAKKNEGFNVSQTKQGNEDEGSFPREEIGIPVRCNVHPFMEAWCSVFRHPFFAVTGADGAYELKGLPPGEYRLTAWHESAKHFGEGRKQTVALTLGPAESKAQDFTFELK